MLYLNDESLLREGNEASFSNFMRESVGRLYGISKGLQDAA